MTYGSRQRVRLEGQAAVEGVTSMLKRVQGTSLLTILLLLLIQVAPALAADLAANDPRAMRFPTVNFNPPDADRVVLENGMIVYLLEDHELPLVTVNATLKTGSWLDPADKVGLAGLTGAVMRTGGSTAMSPEEVDEELEQLAANVSISFAKESGSASLDVLKKDLKRGMHIFADLLRRPAFEESRVDLAKLQALEGIRRRQDSPGSIVGREFAKLLYGATHPSARETTTRSIDSLTREDLVAFYQRTVHPNGIILGVTGDFDKTSLLALLREVFGDWEKGAVPDIAIPPVPETDFNAGAVRFVNKDTSQTHLRVGHLTIKETDPDYVAVAIANDI